MTEKHISRRLVTRRDTLAGGAALIAGAYATTSSLATTPRPALHEPRASKARKPNILFILADDMGYADVSCYGRRDYSTPNIDRLAHNGTRFTQAYANSAVCTATRTALLSGQYQYRFRVGLEEPLAVRNDIGFPPGFPTLPEQLRRAGYETTLLGKWHLGRLPEFSPLKCGYDHFWGFSGGGLDYFTHKLNGEKDLWDDDRPIDTPGYLTDLLADRAIKIVTAARKSERPFFLSLHFNAPHWPWEGPGDMAESARLDALQEKWALAHYDGGSLRTYGEMVVRMDMQIGRILKALEDSGQAQDTLIIFTSDNGGERFSDTWPFTGKKGELLEGGLRIPAIISWPGRVPMGQVSDQLMISMDWTPTLLAAAGASSTDGYSSDGVNVLPQIADGAPTIPRTLFWRYLHLRQRACRDGDWKYLRIDGHEFLFNVVDDPLERANYKERHPDIFNTLVEKWVEWEKEMLPLDPTASSGGFDGEHVADHYGVDRSRK